MTQRQMPNLLLILTAVSFGLFLAVRVLGR
jgi:hypothetical protein